MQKKKVIEMAFLIACIFLSTNLHAAASHEPIETKRRETSSSAPKNTGYKKSKFDACGTDEENWGTVNDIRLTRGLVTPTKNGFAPAFEGDKDAQCVILVVGEEDRIMGKLSPLAYNKNIATYSIIPGELIGIPKAKFFLAPSLDPKIPPQFFPATCDIQNSKPQIVVTDPSQSRDQLVSLVETKLEAEPPKISDSGAN
jgi:hypothetical protein